MSIKRVEWRRMLQWALVLIIVGLGVPMARLIHTHLKAKEGRVGGPIPYTVILKETVHGPNGATTVPRDLIYAIRSDGSYVRRLTHTNPADGAERLVKFSSGIQVTINEFADTKSTILLNVNPARWQRDPNSKCINSFAGTPVTSPPEVVSGEEMVAGYRTVKITRNNVTRWLALDYGCALVKDKIVFSGQEFSEHNLVALIPGEPETALFHVPAHIREVSPSERIKGYDRIGKNCGPDCAKRLHKFDESYYKHRPVK